MQFARPGPEHKEAFLAFEYAASAAYNEFVYADRAQADAVRTALFDAGVAEYCPPHGCVLLAGGAVSGALACLPASELRKCRMRSAFFLGKSPVYREDEALLGRMALAGQTLMKLAAGDYYLSRISARRGVGVGGRLLAHCEGRAAEAGAARICLEVAAANAPAIAFYRKHGFEDVERLDVEDPATGRRLAYLHMVKNVAPAA